MSLSLNTKRFKRQLRSDTQKRQSFDRFGDDLCEEIVQYLPIEEKIRFECVSKQWQRSVYQKQYKLSINKLFDLIQRRDVNKLYIDLNRFESILKKCRNVHSIDFHYIYGYRQEVELMIESIIKYCHYLSSIEFDLYGVNVKTVQRFFDKFSSTLRTITLNSSTKTKLFRNKLKFCVNLKQWNAKRIQLSKVFNEKNILLISKLKKIQFKYSNEDAIGFDVFVNRYKNSLISIEVIIDESIEQKGVNYLMNGLKQMSKLIDLKLVFENKGNDLNVLIAEQLKQIGLKCQKLKSFSFYFRPKTPKVLSEIIQTINKYFKQLKRLDLNIEYVSEDYELLSQSLSDCKQLTHLTLDFSLYSTYICYIKDSFFTDINKYLPKLQYLCIERSNITKYAINSLTKLPNLQTIRIYNNKQQISEPFVNELITDCKKIKRVSMNRKRFL